MGIVIEGMLESGLRAGWSAALLLFVGIVALVRVDDDRAEYMTPTPEGLVCVIPAGRMGEEHGAAASVELEPRGEAFADMFYQEFTFHEGWDFTPSGCKTGWGMNFGHPEGEDSRTWSGGRHPEPGEGSVRLMIRPAGFFAYIYHDAQLGDEPLNEWLGIMPVAGARYRVWMLRFRDAGDVLITIEPPGGAAISRRFDLALTHELTTLTLDVFAGGRPISRREDARWIAPTDRVMTFHHIGLQEIRL